MLKIGYNIILDIFLFCFQKNYYCQQTKYTYCVLHVSFKFVIIWSKCRMLDKLESLFYFCIFIFPGLTCEEIQKPTNGFVLTFNTSQWISASAHRWPVGTIVHFGCDIGYELQGAINKTCVAIGNSTHWDPPSQQRCNLSKPMKYIFCKHG